MARRLVCLSVGLFAAALAGCGSGVSSNKGGTTTTIAPPGMGAGMRGGATKSAPGAGEVMPNDWGGPSDAAPAARVPTPATPARPSPVEAIAGTDRRDRGPKPSPDQVGQPGTLTAGSFDDNVDPRYWRKFAQQAAQDQALGDLPGRLGGPSVVLVVKAADGSPVADARVRVAAAGAGAGGVELTTRTDGRVVVVPAWDRVPADGDLAVTVTPPDGGPPVVQRVPRGADRWELTLPAARARPVRSLDFALVLDTTGSMGDELEYLKTEIRGIATGVRERFPQVDPHYGLVLFRDDGDEYVTRVFDFTPSAEDFRRNLAAQRAAGGGDDPEAMHEGLEKALQLRWRSGPTARVLFLITDAPPRRQFMERTMAAADRLRRQGVAVYPVACSGYNDQAEFILRSCALLTGSQFLFLTDDSGVGNAHGEPHLPSFRVEKLSKLMTRIIAAEIAGKRAEPEKADVLRMVGRPTN